MKAHTRPVKIEDVVRYVKSVSLLACTSFWEPETEALLSSPHWVVVSRSARRHRDQPTLIDVRSRIPR